MMKQNIAAPQWGASRVVLALALAGSCAFAQTDADAPETELPPVTVSAHNGEAVPYDQTGVSVSVLDVPQLRKEGITTLSEALTTVPGVYVMPGGGSNQRGNVSNVIIRGMNSQSHTMPMMDGMRLSTSSGNSNTTANVVGQTDLFALGNVEVLKGAEGAVYGGGAMGGVIYMETPEGKGKPSLTLFNEAGSFDSYTGNVQAQGRIKDTAFFVSATYDRTNNDITYADGSHSGIRHAGKAQSWKESLRLDHYINADNKVTLTYRREDSEYRYAYRYDGKDYFSDYAFMSNLLTAKFQSKVTERYSTSLMAGYYGTDYKFGTTYPSMRNVQVEWRNAFQWNEKNTTTAGFAWTRSDYSSDSGLGRKNSTSDLENTYGIFAEHSIKPIKNWNNSLAVRLDQSSNFDALFSARGATSYQFNQERSRAFASVGRGYRAPSSFQSHTTEFYNPWGWYGPETYIGNPDLECEYNWTADLGFEQQIAKNHYASATLFWSRVENGIENDYVSIPGKITYRNSSSHWTSQGVELALHGSFEDAWNTGYKVACTITQPKNTDDQQLANTARQVWSADIHTSPIKGLTTGIGLAAACQRTSYMAGSHLDNYYTLRWYAQYEVNEHLTFHVRVENLTDQKFISEGSAPVGYSFLNPGTAVYGGCTIKF